MRKGHLRLVGGTDVDEQDLSLDPAQDTFEVGAHTLSVEGVLTSLLDSGDLRARLKAAFDGASDELSERLRRVLFEVTGD
jgi:hypothetical protein